MTVALQEWHRRIPEYEQASTEPIVEYCCSVHGIMALPLKWQP